MRIMTAVVMFLSTDVLLVGKVIIWSIVFVFRHMMSAEGVRGRSHQHNL